MQLRRRSSTARRADDARVQLPRRSESEIPESWQVEFTATKLVVALRERGGLDELVWSHAPTGHRPPGSTAEIPATSPESVALAKALKRAGFVFVGPTTMYAAMQACGLLDDHVVGCHRSGG